MDVRLLPNENLIALVDKTCRLWIHDWTLDGSFFEIVGDEDDMPRSKHRCLTCVNANVFCVTDGEERIEIYSDALTGKT